MQYGTRSQCSAFMLFVVWYRCPSPATVRTTAVIIRCNRASIVWWQTIQHRVAVVDARPNQCRHQHRLVCKSSQSTQLSSMIEVLRQLSLRYACASLIPNPICTPRSWTLSDSLITTHSIYRLVSSDVILLRRVFDPKTLSLVLSWFGRRRRLERQSLSLIRNNVRACTSNREVLRMSTSLYLGVVSMNVVSDGCLEQLLLPWYLPRMSWKLLWSNGWTLWHTAVKLDDIRCTRRRCRRLQFDRSGSN